MNQLAVWIPSAVRKTQLCYNGHEDNFLAERKTSVNVFKSIPVWIPGVVWRANTIVLSPYQAEGWPQWLAGICVVAVRINIRTTAGSLKDKGIGQTSMATIPFRMGGTAHNTDIHDSINTFSFTMASVWQVTVSQRTAAASISFSSESLDTHWKWLCDHGMHGMKWDMAVDMLNLSSSVTLTGGPLLPQNMRDKTLVCVSSMFSATWCNELQKHAYWFLFHPCK